MKSDKPMLWMELPPIKLNTRIGVVHAYISSMNHQELLIQLSPRNIIIYDVEHNSILFNTSLPQIAYIQDIQSFALKKKTNELYLYSHNHMHCITLKEPRNSYPITDTSFPRAGATAKKYLLLIEDEFHIFADHDCHWIASLKDKHVIQNTIGGHQKMLKRDSNFCGKAVYIASKKMIILLTTKSVWSYALKSKEWTRQNLISFAVFCHFDAVLSYNQRYIVMFGDSFTDIFILDILQLHHWKVLKSSVGCPTIGICAAVRTSDDEMKKNSLLVIGFVRECFHCKELEHLLLPSGDIMMLIAQKYNAEMVHVINYKDEHYGIYLHDILDSPLDIFPANLD